MTYRLPDTPAARSAATWKPCVKPGSLGEFSALGEVDADVFLETVLESLDHAEFAAETFRGSGARRDGVPGESYKVLFLMGLQDGLFRGRFGKIPCCETRSLAPAASRRLLDLSKTLRT